MSTLLPEDLVFMNILTKLSAKSLMRFKCVSKNWMTRISGDSSFIDAYRRKHESGDDQLAIVLYNEYVGDGRYDESDDDESEDDEDHELGPLRARVFSEQCSKVSEVDVSYLIAENGAFEFAGSCEGLVCLIRSNELEERVVIWNPVTRQRRQLPSVEHNGKLCGVGMGLDEASGNWKVVHLSRDGSTMVRARVFAKSDTVWRDVGASELKRFEFDGMSPVAAAGALHWSLAPGRRVKRDIVSFDLKDEVLRLANGPPNCVYYALCEWQSTLAAFAYFNGAFGQLMVASPSSTGDGMLSWIRLVEFTLEEDYEGMTSVWRDQFLLRQIDLVSLVDSKDLTRVRKLTQLRLDFDGCFFFHNYVHTINSVF